MKNEEITLYLTSIGYTKILYPSRYNNIESSFMWTDKETTMQINIDIDNNIDSMVRYSYNEPTCPIMAYYEGGCTSYSSFSINSIDTLQCIVNATRFVPYGENELNIEQVSTNLKNILNNCGKYYA